MSNTELINLCFDGYLSDKYYLEMAQEIVKKFEAANINNNYTQLDLLSGAKVIVENKFKELKPNESGMYDVDVLVLQDIIDNIKSVRNKLINGEYGKICY